MRILLAVLLFATPTHAWEFSPGAPCLLTHAGAEARVTLTYDPTEPLYSITITRPVPWPEAPAFHMRFDGPQGRMIGTDLHSLSPDGHSLTVTDRGFGNVLDGLQYNHRAYAQTGDVVVSLSLEGASVPVAAFRACAPVLPIS